MNSADDFQAGLLEPAVDKVVELVRSDPNLTFNLTLDEVHIRKTEKNNWDSRTKKWVGVVNTAGEFPDCNDDGIHLRASKSLTFMLVAINAHFKIPVAYYFIDGLNGEKKLF